MRPSLVDHFEPAQTGEQGQQRQAHDGEEVAFDFLDQLRAKGVSIEEKQIVWERGKHAWIRDLDGNRVELYEELLPTSDESQ